MILPTILEAPMDGIKDFEAKIMTLTAEATARCPLPQIRDREKAIRDAYLEAHDTAEQAQDAAEDAQEEVARLRCVIKDAWDAPPEVCEEILRAELLGHELEF
jgi:hypothetical protein